MEIETDKVTVEVRAETAGKLVALFAEEGATVEVGADLYELDLDVTAGAAAPVAVPVPPPAPSTPSAAPPPLHHLTPKYEHYLLQTQRSGGRSKCIKREHLRHF